MEVKYENIIINYQKENKDLVNKIIKELKKFVDKYKKILVLNKQKEIEVNFINSDKLEISITNRLINVSLLKNVNTKELAILLETKILNILEKDKVVIPSYIKDQISNSFDLKGKIKENKEDTEKIIRKIDRGV